MDAALKTDPPAATANPSAEMAQAQRHDGATSAKVPETLFVLDTTAIPGRGPRTHDMIVGSHNGRPLIRPYTFEPATPLELPTPIAIKFLKIPAFQRTDAKGTPLPYHRQPKQPHELAAGEKLQLSNNQTVADYGELSNVALLQRALELPGGESVGQDRQALIDFIIGKTVALRQANMDKAARARADADELELADIEAFEED